MQQILSRLQRTLKPGSKSFWVVALLLVVGIGWLGKSLWPANEAMAQQLYTVTRGDIEDSIGSLGSLEPKNYVDVGTQVSGQLQRLLVGIGDVVEKGQLLAEIDPTVFESRVRNSRATFSNLQAQLTLQRAEQKLAERRLQRNQVLYADKAVSEDVLLASETEVEANRSRIVALQAQIDAAEASLEGDLANLGYTKIYAPMSGTVVDSLAIQGQTINASQTAPIIVRIANLNVMTVRAQVSEADVVRIYAGMPVYFTTLGAPERRWRSEVRKVLPTPVLINNVVLYNVLIDVENTDSALMTSMTAQVFFLRAEAHGVLVIPTDALTQSTQPTNSKSAMPIKGTAVIAAHAATKSDAAKNAVVKNGTSKNRATAQVEVVTPKGTELRDVTLGVRTRTQVEVLSGLSEGEQIVSGRLPIGAANNAAQRGLLNIGGGGPGMGGGPGRR